MYPFLAAIFIIYIFISQYFQVDIKHLSEIRSNFDKTTNIENVASCIKDTYLENYTTIHYINLYNYTNNNNALRLENNNKLLLNSKELEWITYDNTSLSYTFSKLETLFTGENSYLLDVFKDMKKCINNDSEFYYIEFKETVPLVVNNLTIPYLNMNIYTVNEENDLKFNNTILTNGKKIFVEKDIFQLYNELKNTMQDLSKKVIQYTLVNAKNNLYKNNYSFENGVLDINLSTNLGKDFVFLNGGQTGFLQSNKKFYLVNNENYLIQENSSSANVTLFKYPSSFVSCSSALKNSISTNNAVVVSFDSVSNSGSKSCKNGFVKPNNINNTCNSSLSDFKSNIGGVPFYMICKIGDNDVQSTPHELNNNFWYERVLPDIYDKLNISTFYYQNKELWSGIEDYIYIIKTTNNLNETRFEVKTFKDFFKEKFLLDITTYKNPFFNKMAVANTTKPFEFLIDNSSYELYKEVIDVNATQTIKSNSRIRFGMPIVIDQFSNIEFNGKQNFILEKQYQLTEIKN